MLSVIMLNVTNKPFKLSVMLNAVLLSVVILCVVTLSAVVHNDERSSLVL